MMHGWTVEYHHPHHHHPPPHSTDAAARACLVFIEWGSLDHMFEIKKDGQSLFNNCFVPLRDEAEGGIRTALYTRLRDGGGGWCGVM